MRSRRKPSNIDIYHVMVRGVGRQIIFEDDYDRQSYLSGLKEMAAKYDIEVLAWCLMANHVHLLLHASMDMVSACMREFGSKYTRYFNLRHDRVGHLFQGRFKSVPVESEEQLLTVVRYIHRNPVEAGVAPSCLFPWSSYGEYIDKSVYDIVDTDLVPSLFSSVEKFESFNAQPEGDAATREMGFKVFPIQDNEAVEIYKAALMNLGIEEISFDDKKERNKVLCYLKNHGLTIRQISMLTGIGRNIIARA